MFVTQEYTSSMSSVRSAQVRSDGKLRDTVRRVHEQQKIMAKQTKKIEELYQKLKEVSYSVHHSTAQLIIGVSAANTRRAACDRVDGRATQQCDAYETASKHGSTV